ncbi:hypothetical protein SVXHr_2673 [Halorhabdus sp. SVX81]|uniref:hypothetical protein n=1 Tax=Halorhabdus sp. SVX81 TaxID=2978283 RepID=UPI0023DA5835|nr:hypothetical protein [Halorhabdus sp. SVX81]WEL18817.1 hypothetical protein SVXHr_2673 [Halorhabdus sp. SVX81]
MENEAVFSELLGDRVGESAIYLLVVVLLGVVAGENVLEISYPPIRVTGAYLAVAVPAALLIAYRNRGLLVVYAAIVVPVTAADTGFSVLVFLYRLSAPIYLFSSHWIGFTVLVYAVARSLARLRRDHRPAPIEGRLLHSDWRVTALGWVTGAMIGVLLVTPPLRVVLEGVLFGWLAVSLLAGWLLIRYGGGLLSVVGLFSWSPGLAVAVGGDPLAVLAHLGRALGAAGTGALVVVVIVVAVDRVSAFFDVQSVVDTALEMTVDQATAGGTDASAEETMASLREQALRIGAGAVPWLALVPAALLGEPKGAGPTVLVGYATIVAVGLGVATVVTTLPFAGWGRSLLSRTSLGPLDERARQQFAAGALLGLFILLVVAFGGGPANGIP